MRQSGTQNTKQNSISIGLNVAGETECTCLAAGWCERRKVVISSVHFAKCKAGKVDHIDRVYIGLKSQRTKSTALKFAAPSPATTIGTEIRTALESAGHLNRLTGKCRNYLNSLNQPQRHDTESITDRLVELLEFECVKNIRRKTSTPVSRQWIAEIVTAAIQSAAEAMPVKPDTGPSVSDVGTRLQSAIETSCKFTMTCGSCKTFLRSLNQTTAHDVDTITETLLLQLQIPRWKREEVGGTKEQRVWLRAIVAEIIGDGK